MIMTSARTATDVEAATRPSLDRLKENGLFWAIVELFDVGAEPLTKFGDVRS